jgi:uncharacterized membrane protein YfcA
MWDIILPIFGFLIGIAAALAGVGGGVFIVPLLTILYGVDIKLAVGTSLTTIIFTAIASTLNYAKQKRIYYKTGLIVAIATVPGSYLGANILKLLAPDWVSIIFGLFLIFVAARMIIGSNHSEHKAKEKTSQQSAVRSDTELIRSGKTILIGAGLSFFGGLASGLLGIGGGVLVVPIMTFFMGMPIHFATATSMFTMIFTSISGVTQHLAANNVNSEYAILLALGTIFGAQVGAYVSKKISSKNLRRFFAILLIVVSIKMIL